MKDHKVDVFLDEKLRLKNEFQTVNEKTGKMMDKIEYYNRNDAQLINTGE